MNKKSLETIVIKYGNRLSFERSGLGNACFYLWMYAHTMLSCLEDDRPRNNKGLERIQNDLAALANSDDVKNSPCVKELHQDISLLANMLLNYKTN